MDPITQGVLGACAPLSIAPQKHAKMAGLLGLLGGMAPDLDVFIRSNTDPLLFLEFHRQFTHSLVFIPLGGFVVALLLYALLKRRWSMPFSRYVIYCTLGYATHAVLDACTTYGTMLLWPFSDARIAWNTLSVVDPVFTVPVAVLVLAAALQRSSRCACLALAWAILYPTLGLVQRDRAIEAGWKLAASRGHSPTKLEAKPSFGNILLWKTVYETDANYHVDAIRAGMALKVYPGESVSQLNIARDFPWLHKDSQQAIDIERFRWFSNGYLASDPGRENTIIDIRYSMIPSQAAGLWGIMLTPDAGSLDHVEYQSLRTADAHTLDQFWAMLRGF